MNSSLGILTAGLLLFSCRGHLYCQNFIVNCADDRSRHIVIDILSKLHARLSTDTTDVDYIIECRITSPEKFNAKHKGYIVIYDKAHTEISRTKEIKRVACATNGFNAAADIFQVLAEDHMPPLIEKIIKQ